MKAILSDIHGNLEALQAVLDDAARNAAEEVYCLGDLVGYGPNPCECIESAMKWKLVIQGNFDSEVLNDPPSLGPTAIVASRSLVWSRKQILAPIRNAEAPEKRWAFSTKLSTTHSECEILFVHASPRNPLNEYVYAEHMHDPDKRKLIFEPVGRLCFHGHTHLPGVMLEDGNCLSLNHTDDLFQPDDRKALVNVGSVGQPRDGDWRASYVLFDDETVRFRRVEYDIETTIRKIRDIDDLDDFSGDRLRDGR